MCGAEELEVDTKRRRLTAPNGVVIEEGDVVSIDGSTGKVYVGEVPVVPSPVVEYFEGRMHAGADDADELVAAVHRIMAYADRVRRLRVRANADNAEDALRAGASAPRASACAAPSTCSSATAASSWNG